MVLLCCGKSNSNDNGVARNKDITTAGYNVCGTDSATDDSDRNAAVGYFG